MCMYTCVCACVYLGGGWVLAFSRMILLPGHNKDFLISMILPDLIYVTMAKLGFHGGSDAKESACQARNPGFPGSGRSLGGRHCNPLQYFCLENPTDREAWQATVHRAAKSWT